MKLRFIMLLAILTVAIILRAQKAGQPKGATPPPKPTPAPALIPPAQPKTVQVDLCQLALQIANGPAAGITILPVGHQPVQLPPHLDVRLSYSNQDQARFFCSPSTNFSVDSFVKAEMPPTDRNIPQAPAAPFSSKDLQNLATKSSSPRLSGVPLANAVGQRYKFSFTIYPDGQAPQHHDPHLIITK